MARANKVKTPIELVLKSLRDRQPAKYDRFDVFTPGIYTRLLRIQPGVYVTGKHKTEHPYHVHTGILKVWTEADGWKDIAGHGFGVTVPGTQRIFIILEETLWVTTHATDIIPQDDTPGAHEKAVDEITNLLIEDPGLVLNNRRKMEAIK